MTTRTCESFQMISHEPFHFSIENVLCKTNFLNFLTRVFSRGNVGNSSAFSIKQEYYGCCVACPSLRLTKPLLVTRLSNLLDLTMKMMRVPTPSPLGHWSFSSPAWELSPLPTFGGIIRTGDNASRAYGHFGLTCTSHGQQQYHLLLIGGVAAGLFNGKDQVAEHSEAGVQRVGQNREEGCR
jgi:hypothetical protein